MLRDPQLTPGQAQTILATERVKRIRELDEQIARARQAAHEYATYIATCPERLIDQFVRWSEAKEELAEDLEHQRDAVLAAQEREARLCTCCGQTATGVCCLLPRVRWQS